MTMMRQVQLRRGSTTLDLNTSPYDVVAGSWTAAGPQLEMRVLVQATTLAELRRYVAAVRRMLNQAQHYAEESVGSAVYVYTKTCDDLTTTAELGATWLRKRIKAGSVMEPDASEMAQGRYALTLVVSLETDDTWRRAAPANILAATGTVTARSDGGVTAAGDSPNLLINSSFQVDTDANGVADSWSTTNGGPEVITSSRPATGGVDNGAFQRVAWVVDNTSLKGCLTSSATSGGVQGDWLPYKTYIVSFYAKATLTGTAATDIFWDTQPSVKTTISNPNLTTSWQRYIYLFTWGASVQALGSLHISIFWASGGTGSLDIDHVQVEQDDTVSDWQDYTTAGGVLTARRVTWTAATGLTVRVRWTYVDRPCYFFLAETGANDMKALYSAGDNKLYIYDDGGNVASSSALTATAGDELDIVFKWDPTTPKLGIWVNGTANGSAASGTLDAADTYQIFAPSTASQTLLSWQLWPTALTDAQCAALSAWGRSEPELAYYTPLTDTKNTNAAYKVYNVPGEADARLRLLLSDATQAYDKFRVGIRPLRIQTTTLWECEAGTNGTDVADAADATASGGNVAQFTPSDTSYATRSTIVLAANPADMSAFYGQYRLLLAVKDNAAAINVNVLKWRLVCAGVATDYSAEYAAAAVSTYSLLDLGTLTLPPGEWPEETENCTTDVVGGSYLTLEIQAKNTTGGGGGTLNLDAVYLQPVEFEGVVDCASLTTAQFMALDFASDPPAAVVVASATSFEYSAFGTYLGDELALAPAYGDAGLVMVYAYRDAAEKAYPNDAVTVYLFYRPGWL